MPEGLHLVDERANSMVPPKRFSLEFHCKSVEMLERTSVLSGLLLAMERESNIMPEDEKTPEVAALTVQLLSAYLSNNTVAPETIAELIRSTKSALIEDVAAPAAAEESQTYTPAVTARKSLSSPDHILSMIDGKAYKLLKRHLNTHGLTPEQYRERYNLPSTYPMVAPSFAAKRREIAQQIGLGSRGRGVTVSQAKADAGPTAVTPSAAASESTESQPAAPVANATTAKAKSGRKAAAKPPASVTKAATRKAKAAGDNDTSVPDAVPVEQTVEPVATAKAAPKAAIRKKAASNPVVAKPKKASISKAASKSVSEPAPSPAVSEASAKPAKRRQTLGLFGKNGADETMSGAAAGNDETPPVVSEENNKPKAAKPVRAKRMARAPKVAASKAVPDSTDGAS